ncbi:MAG: hypothetical protein Q8R28_03410 [Dehalococcoidia bacterium]|nr:hypothetical protein [Dehalococcoidia bacterium]
MSRIAQLRNLLAIVFIVSSFLASAPTSVAGPAPQGPGPLRYYLVRLTEPNLVVLASESAQLIAQEKARDKSRIASTLDSLASAGLAGGYSFDEDEGAFRALLSDLAREQLTTNPLVAAVEPQAEMSRTPSSLPAGRVGIQAVASAAFIQVYSPFVWGQVSVGGLSVQLTLEDGTGTVLGVPSQGTALDSIKIDMTRLYYETVFKDPVTHELVNIVPGNVVHVVTTGINPVDGLPYTDSKEIVVDDVRAWTSYEQDRVSGAAPPGSSVIVTVSSLGISQYVDPTNYAELTAGPDGSFSASNFRTGASGTYRSVGLAQGSTGFVRVVHSDLNEVYTVHGQNVMVLENSSVLHGYAFGLPQAPSGLDSGVAVSPRPAQSVTVTLKNSSGAVKDTATPSRLAPYVTGLSATISPGDEVDVSLSFNQAQPYQIAVAPLTASVELGANQITGSGPASSQIVLGAGRISGYVTSSSSADFIVKRVAANGAGAFSSGQIQCGTSNFLTFKRGSFGYAGYEDLRGNFVYIAMAAPTNHIMSDYPFLQGWIADGTVRPAITLRDSTGNIKQEVTASPIVMYLANQKLYMNTYYHIQTSQFIVPGDSVTIVSGGQTSSIQVDRVTGYVNTDANTVDGEAPAGASVRVVPLDDRAARREVVADSSGVYSAGSPFTSLSNSTCAESPKTEDFTPGDSGRVYVRHPDGNEVFASYGRSMHVLENENYLEIYPFVARDLDWSTTPSRAITVTVTPKLASPVTVQANSQASRSGKTQVRVTTGTPSQKVLIRFGDSVAVSFYEGPVGLTRQVTLSMNSLALVTGAPDVDTNTLGGVGPKGWPGRATLNPPPTVKPTAIQPSDYTAYSPVSFLDSSGSLKPLLQGYSGLVSFSDTRGHRIWIAWAVTAYPVKITGWLKPGDTQVCGKAPPGGAVRIHDVTLEGQDIVIATGTADAQGNYCVTVSALYEDQVLMAESDGTFSQPVIVRRVQRIFMPYLAKQQA